MALISIVGIIALSLSGNISEIIKIVGILVFAGLRLMPSISKIIFSIQQLKYNKPAMNVVYDILKISNEKILDTKDDNNISTINFDKNIGKFVLRFSSQCSFIFKTYNLLLFNFK